MKPENWQDTKSMIEDKFKIIEQGIEPVKMKVGLDQEQEIGKKEFLVFNSPLGKVRLEFLTKPIIIDKKEHYSRRMGTSSATEYILSKDEFSYKMEAYLEKDGEWEKIDASSIGE